MRMYQRAGHGILGSVHNGIRYTSEAQEAEMVYREQMRHKGERTSRFELHLFLNVLYWRCRAILYTKCSTHTCLTPLAEVSFMRWRLLRPMAWRLKHNTRPLEQSICYSLNIRCLIYPQFPQHVAAFAALHEHDGIVATVLIFPYQYRHLVTTPQLRRAVRVVASKGTRDVGGVFIADALVGVGAVEVWSRCNVCSDCGCDFVVVA